MVPAASTSARSSSRTGSKRSWTALPREFLRGLIHSDGCRVLNRVNGKDYPRYFFTQVSDDIRGLFCETCRRLGIHYTQNNWKTISIARSGSVSRLDEFVGPKA